MLSSLWIQVEIMDSDRDCDIVIIDSGRDYDIIIMDSGKDYVPKWYTILCSLITMTTTIYTPPGVLFTDVD